MKILIDVVHPAHVHFFKYAIREWEKKGNQVLITARDKEITINLLRSYDLSFICISSYGKGLSGLCKELMIRDYRLLKIARKFRPDILTGIAGISIAHIAKIIRRPSIVFYDTEQARLSNMLNFPFATVICTPSCYRDNLGQKQIRYEGYQELAYLHPHWFKPDPKVIKEQNLTPGERFFVLRFISWGAAHDVGQRGLGNAEKCDLVKELEKHGQVLITSEANLPSELAEYQISLSPEKIHHLLYYSTLYFGESPTMASESAILGTPAILVSSFACKLGNMIEMERKYDLMHSFSYYNEGIRKALELLKANNLKPRYRKKKERLLQDKIDVTRWVVKLIEDYPIGRKVK